MNKLLIKTMNGISWKKGQQKILAVIFNKVSIEKPYWHSFKLKVNKNNVFFLDERPMKTTIAFFR